MLRTQLDISNPSHHGAICAMCALEYDQDKAWQANDEVRTRNFMYAKRALVHWCTREEPVDDFGLQVLLNFLTRKLVTTRKMIHVPGNDGLMEEAYFECIQHLVPLYRALVMDIFKRILVDHDVSSCLEAIMCSSDSDDLYDETRRAEREEFHHHPVYLCAKSRLNSLVPPRSIKSSRRARLVLQALSSLVASTDKFLAMQSDAMWYPHEVACRLLVAHDYEWADLFTGRRRALRLQIGDVMPG